MTWRAWFFWFAVPIFGQVAYPPDKPFLRIETGMHTARIIRIDVDAAGRYLVSASEDKTARIWDLRDGKLLRIVRPPQGDDEAGMLYAVAISPDGSTVATGGFTGPRASHKHPIFIFDRQTGAIRQVLPALPDATNHLSYSRDGRYLVAALQGNNGVVVYETETYHEVRRDAAGGTTYWAEFGPDGRLVTASLDGRVRLYESDLRLPPLTSYVEGGKEPVSARFSPDGKRIAVGFLDSMRVTILSSTDLGQVPSSKIDLKGTSLDRVAWSPDGKTLCAGGNYSTDNLAYPILCWDAFGKKLSRTIANAASTVDDLRFLRDGRLVFASGKPELGFQDRDGSPVWRTLPDILDLLLFPNQLRLVGGDAVEFRFLSSDGESWTNHLLRFVPNSHRLLSINAFTGNPPQSKGLNVQNWENTRNPTLDGHALEIEDTEFSRSLAITPSGDRFVLGCAFSIRVYDRNGKQIRRIPIPGTAFAVNLTSDSRYIVAALQDGTIRWYEMDTGKEALALFVHRDLKRWVAWTPEGFFDASPGGEDLVGYHINHGPDHEGEFVKVDQLFDTFYRPDLVSQRLKPGGAQAIAAAVAKVGDINQILARDTGGGAPPNITNVQAQTLPTGEVKLTFDVTDRGGGIGSLFYTVDGTRVPVRSGGLPGFGGPRTITVPLLSPGSHQIAPGVSSRNGKVETIFTTPLSVQGPNRAGSGTLYVVAAGVSHYSKTPTLNAGVQFAVKDARDVSARLEQEGGRMFDRVVPYPMPDSTHSQIEKQIEEVTAKMQPNDAFILYLAGHGVAIDREYYFLAADAVNTSNTTIRDSSLGQKRLEQLLQRIPPGSRTLLLVDTCSAGAIIDDNTLHALYAMGHVNGRSIIAGAASGKMAIDGYNDHGLFTYFLLEGLVKAKGADGIVTPPTLADYVQTKVQETANARWHIDQKPVALTQGERFALARPL